MLISSQRTNAQSVCVRIDGRHGKEVRTLTNSEPTNDNCFRSGKANIFEAYYIVHSILDEIRKEHGGKEDSVLLDLQLDVVDGWLKEYLEYADYMEKKLLVR